MAFLSQVLKTCTMHAFQLKFEKSWPFEKHFPLYMAFNAIKIRKLYYGAKTLDSLSYRKIQLKLRQGFWVV